MAVETVAEARRVLAHEGFVEELVADGRRLRAVASGRTYAPAELAVARVIRLRGITTPEEEAVLFGLATGDGQPVGAYVPTFRPAMAAEDEAIAAELHQRVSREDEVRSHGRHDHVGRPAEVEEIMERHGGDLVLRAGRP